MSEEAETSTTNDSSTKSSSASSSARARAEARRRRILQKSKDRMSVVSGEVNVDQVDLTTADTNNTDTKQNEEKVDEEGTKNDNVESSTTTTAATEATVSGGGDDADEVVSDLSPRKGSSRLAQMRQRRYKKAAAAAAVTDNADEKEQESNADNTEETTKTTMPTTVPDATTTTTATGGDDDESSEKKKYLGVVKMRRKMLAEKKASEAQTEAENYKEVKKILSSKKIKKDKKVIPLGPIVVQFLTVVLMFLVGFDIGVQNHVVMKQTVPNVHHNYAAVDHGIGALKFVGVKNTKLPSQLNTNIVQNNMDLDEVEKEEEFANIQEEDITEVKPAGASASSKKEPNIDPIFGVDFDEMTAGDGLFLSAVRLAVSVHRMLTYLFFTTPLAFISGLFALPKRIMVNPPIMFLCAIVIRYVGKHVLGGAIPDLDKMLEDEINDSDVMKGKENVVDGIAKTDFVSMGKNFVTNFLKTNFPKASLVYTMFTDARSDMFVVFCGFFLGLVLPSNFLGHEGPFSVSEEL